MNEIKNLINPNLIPNLHCDTIVDEKPDGFTINCSCDTFNQVFHIKKVSRMLSPNGQEGYIMIPVYLCTRCGKEIILK